jgi:hypothetical protein
VPDAVYAPLKRTLCAAQPAHPVDARSNKIAAALASRHCQNSFTLWRSKSYAARNRTPDIGPAIERGDPRLVASIDAATRAEISPGWLARIRTATAPDPWTHGFTILNRANGATIGSCAYKGPPDADQTVEIAYGIDPEY